jgi:hypothetical protein
MANDFDPSRAVSAGSPEPPRRWNSAEVVVAAVAALGALVFLVWRAHLFFPNSNGLLGHDYAWFFPTLLVGHFWHRQNGWLTPPHFTPAFCGGVPFLANPQSVFFSLPQLLLTMLEPTPAMFATLVVSATVGATGCYRLLRRHFKTSVSAATLAATLFLLNGFLFYRLVIGHLTYHAFAVVPLLACVVASAQEASSGHRRRPFVPSCAQVVCGGLCIAYLTYGGAVNFQIPALLTVACTLLMLQIARGFTVRPWLVLAGSGLWGALISAMKLVPAALFAGQFPRPYLPDYMFAVPEQMLTMMGLGLFAPAALPNAIRFPSGAALRRHEFELGLSIVPLVLIALAVHRRGLTHFTTRRRLQWAALTGLLLIPIVLTFGPRHWGVLLLHVPVLNGNTTFVRWWALYLLPLVVAAARCFDVMAPTVRHRCAMLLLCVAVVVAQEAAHNSEYYTAQTSRENAYDPGPITSAFRQVERGIALPAITRIATGNGSGLRSNDMFIAGASSWPCYEPLFGYRSELLPPPGLVIGPVTLNTADGRLNLVDPANYLHGSTLPANTWRFEKSRESEARLFIEYRPYSSTLPWWHQAATMITVAALILSLAIVMLRTAELLAQILSRRHDRLACHEPFKRQAV